MWLSSSEHPSWGRPRRVVFQRLLHGPADRREYALLTIDSDSAAGTHDEPCASGLVVTARFDRLFDHPEPGHPVHVHVWLLTGGTRVQGDRFEPMTTNADAWCTLYAFPEEAQEKRARPW